MRDDRERLRDILEAIEKIYTHAQQGREIFDKDEMLQVWVIHHIQIIGEAARAVSDHLRNRATNVPWSTIISASMSTRYGRFSSGICPT